MAQTRSILRSAQFLNAGFPLYLMEVEQGASPAHGHDFYEMVYVRRGRGAHILQGEKYALRAGDLYIIHPGESHQFLMEPSAKIRIVNVLWQPSLVRQVLRAEGSALSLDSLPYIEPLLKPRAKFRHRLHLSGSTAFRVEGILDEMRREIESSRAGKDAVGCHSLLRHLFCALLILLSRAWQNENSLAMNAEPTGQAGQQRELVARAVGYLEDHLAQQVRVAQVASHVALSPSRLAHIFKQETGRSVIEYLHEMRLDRVVATLEASPLPIQQIAADCGFGDLRFFHRIFRRHFGCSPQQWRSDLKN